MRNIAINREKCDPWRKLGEGIEKSPGKIVRVGEYGEEGRFSWRLNKLPKSGSNVTNAQWRRGPFCAEILTSCRGDPLSCLKNVPKRRKLLKAQRKEENRSRRVRSPLCFRENTFSLTTWNWTAVDPGELVSCVRLVEAPPLSLETARSSLFCPHNVSYLAHICKLRYPFDVTAATQRCADTELGSSVCVVCFDLWTWSVTDLFALFIN